MRIIILILIFGITNFHTLYSQTDSTNPIASKIRPVPEDSGFKMEGYWIWGASVIKAEDDKYHMFASRWPDSIPFHPGWMFASEIVRATADQPQGPFTFQEVVLPARGPQYWDGRSTHNPSITKYKDTYVLFYMGSTHPFDEPDSFVLDSPETTAARSNKRIGIATAPSIHGPWTRFDRPILDTKPETFYSFLTSNPAPLIRKDGSAYLVFKGRGHKTSFPYQTRQHIGIAKAEHYKGPYTVLNDDQTIFSNTSEIEDPFIWEDHNGFHLIAKDMGSKFTGEHHAGVLFHSKDGINWEVDANPKAYSRNILFENGTTKRMGHLERPFILFENGKPKCLYFATMDGKGGFENGSKSWNIAIPLKQ